MKIIGLNHSEVIRILPLIRPSAEWHLQGDELNWMDSKQECPTLEELQDALNKLDKLDYRSIRGGQYPPIGDQLDAIWGMLSTMKMPEECDAMFKRVQAVKERFPKP